MYYFIVNPLSQSGKGLRMWKQTEAILDERKVKYEAFLLGGPGEAAELAGFLSMNKTPCTIVIVGGDGTINEFLSGLPTFEGITLGYIPTGSGNDFSRGMQIPAKPEDAVNIILAPKKIRKFNIGITSSGRKSQSFAVSSGMGFDAAVCDASYSSPLKSILNKLHAGKLIYLANALRMLFYLKPFSIRLLIDDSRLLTFSKVYFATAMNTKYEGGGFMFCPNASPADDYLDLIVVDNISKLKVLFLLPTAFFGKHTGFQGIHIYRCKRAVIQSETESCVHADGEHFGNCKKVAFELLEEKLRIIAG